MRKKIKIIISINKKTMEASNSMIFKIIKMKIVNNKFCFKNSRKITIKNRNQLKKQIQKRKQNKNKNKRLNLNRNRKKSRNRSKKGEAQRLKKY